MKIDSKPAVIKEKNSNYAKRRGKEVASTDESDTDNESNTDDDSNGSSDDGYDSQRFEEDKGGKKISQRIFQRLKERKG